MDEEFGDEAVVEGVAMDGGSGGGECSAVFEDGDEGELGEAMGSCKAWSKRGRGCHSLGHSGSSSGVLTDPPFV